MSLDDRALLLQRELLFRVLTIAKPPVAVAKALAQAITDVYFEAGATIFSEGDESDAIYFLVDGEVSLETDGEEPWTFTRGGVVGVLDVNLERPRARSAFARSYVHAMMLKIEDWFEITEDNFEYTINTRRGIAGDMHRITLGLAPTGAFEEPPHFDDFDVVPDMNAIARLVVLRSAPVFRHASVQALASLATIAKSFTFRAGESIFDHATDDPFIHLVAWGIVDLERQMSPVIRASFGPGALVGGSSAFAGVMHEYEARARTDVTVLRIKLSELDDVAEDHFDLTRSITKYLALERERVMKIRGRVRSSGIPAPLPLTIETAG